MSGSSNTASQINGTTGDQSTLALLREIRAYCICHNNTKVITQDNGRENNTRRAPGSALGPVVPIDASNVQFTNLLARLDSNATNIRLSDALCPNRGNANERQAIISYMASILNIPVCCTSQGSQSNFASTVCGTLQEEVPAAFLFTDGQPVPLVSNFGFYQPEHTFPAGPFPVIHGQNLLLGAMGPVPVTSAQYPQHYLTRTTGPFAGCTVDGTGPDNTRLILRNGEIYDKRTLPATQTINGVTTDWDGSFPPPKYRATFYITKLIGSRRPPPFFESNVIDNGFPPVGNPANFNDLGFGLENIIIDTTAEEGVYIERDDVFLQTLNARNTNILVEADTSRPAVGPGVTGSLQFGFGAGGVVGINMFGLGALQGTPLPLTDPDVQTYNTS